VDRYVRLGTVCLLFLGGMYVWGLVSAYLQMSRSPSSQRDACNEVAEADLKYSSRGH
jgi:hypothetical protein